MKQALTIITLIFFLCACRTSSDVINGRKFQKRKYTSGWHVNTGIKRSETFHASDTVQVRKHAHKPDVIDDKSERIVNKATQNTNHVADETTVIHEDELTHDESLTSDLNNVISISEKIANSYNTKEQQQSLGEKKKRRKEKLTAHTIFGLNSIALGSWFIGWPLDLPYVAIPLIGIGMILLILSLTKLKKSQKRNKFRCILGLILGVGLIILAFV